MKPLDIGRLNKRITFLNFEEGIDEMGQDTKQKVPFCSVWATVKPLTATEPVEAGRIQPQQGYTITIRYRKGITTDLLIEYAGKLLEIQSVVDAEEKHYMLILQCTEKEGAEKHDNELTGLWPGGTAS